MIAQHLVVPAQNGVTWKQIGGRVSIIEELKEAVILPLKLKTAHALLQPPKGNLMVLYLILTVSC